MSIKGTSRSLILIMIGVVPLTFCSTPPWLKVMDCTAVTDSSSAAAPYGLTVKDVTTTSTLVSSPCPQPMTQPFTEKPPPPDASEKSALVIESTLPTACARPSATMAMGASPGVRPCKRVADKSLVAVCASRMERALAASRRAASSSSACVQVPLGIVLPLANVGEPVLASVSVLASERRRIRRRRRASCTL